MSISYRRGPQIEYLLIYVYSPDMSRFHVRLALVQRWPKHPKLFGGSGFHAQSGMVSIYISFFG